MPDDSSLLRDRRNVRDHVDHSVALCAGADGRAFIYCSECREEVSFGSVAGATGLPHVTSGVLRDVDGRLELEAQ